MSHSNDTRFVLIFTYKHAGNTSQTEVQTNLETIGFNLLLRGGVTIFVQKIWEKFPMRPEPPG